MELGASWVTNSVQLLPGGGIDKEHNRLGGVGDEQNGGFEQNLVRWVWRRRVVRQESRGGGRRRGERWDGMGWDEMWDMGIGMMVDCGLRGPRAPLRFVYEAVARRR